MGQKNKVKNRLQTLRVETLRLESAMAHPLFALRDRMGVDCRTLGELLGVSAPSVRVIETGRGRRMSYELLEKILENLQALDPDGDWNIEKLLGEQK